MTVRVRVMHFLVKNRVRQRLDWLKPLATETIAPVADISWFTVPDYLPFAEAVKGDFRPFAIPTQWGAQGPKEKAYFRLQFSLPKSAKGKRVILRVKSGGEGICLRADGTPWQGLDWVRSDLTLTDAAQGGEAYELYLEVTPAHGYAGDYRGPVTFEQAEIVSEDPTLAEAVFLVESCVQLADVLTGEGGRWQRPSNLPPEESFRADRIWKALDAVMCAFPWGTDDRTAYRKAAVGAAKTLAPFLRQRGDEGRLTLDLVGNSHLDTAWLWPLSETRRKCGRTFSTAINYMRRYPKYRFTQSQPQLYQYTKSDYPELFAEITQRVAEGRWDATGAMWVEPDTNVPSGESLVRQILLGNGFYEKEFGLRSRILWLPDVFGYSAALPQILSRAGVPYFFTAKLGVNEDNRFPYGWFRWEGIDGTQIVAHVQLAGYGGSLTPRGLGYNERVRKVPEADFSTFLFGHGDGGGGPTEADARAVGRFDDVAGLPKTRVRPIEETFDEAATADLPRWRGELYFENHRGTYTTHAMTKKLNRQCELALRDAEMLATWEMLQGGEASAATFAPLWETVCLNQFHDILPGSSRTFVYEEAVPQLTDVRDQARRLAREAMARLTKRADGAVAVANTLSWPRTDVVALPDSYSGDLPTQTVAGGKLALVATPGMGLFAAQDATPDGLTAAGRVLTNRFVRATFNAKGQLVSLYDVEHDREALAAGEVGNEIRLHEDRPGPVHYGGGNDAWDVSVHSERCYRTLEASKAELVERGPIRATIRFTYRWERGEIVQEASLYAHSRRVEFRTHVVWNEDQRMLRAHFPLAINSDQATYEIQYGHLRRPTHRNTTWEAAKFEVCGHKWADLSEGGFGVAVLNDCKYGYGANANRMSITLLRATTSPDPVADRGEHDFTYAVMPHGADLLDVVKEAYALNVPLLAAGDRAPKKQLQIGVSAEHAVLDTMKPAEDGKGVIVRFYEALNQRGRVTLSAPAIGAVTETNLVEQNERKLKNPPGSATFDLKPFEVKTLRVMKK